MLNASLNSKTWWHWFFFIKTVKQWTFICSLVHFNPNDRTRTRLERGMHSLTSRWCTKPRMLARISACCCVNISVVLDTLNYIWVQDETSCRGKQLSPQMRGFSKRRKKRGKTREKINWGEGGDESMIMPIDLLGNTFPLLVYPFSHTSDPVSIPPSLQRRDFRLSLWNNKKQSAVKLLKLQSHKSPLWGCVCLFLATFVATQGCLLPSVSHHWTVITEHQQ